MKRAFTQAFTGRDNFTVDAFRVLAVVAVVIGMGLEVFVVIWRAGQGFDLQAYGIGIGGLLLAAGGALKLKESTEPTDSVTVTKKSETTLTETR
jgi:hypothetical protein